MGRAGHRPAARMCDARPLMTLDRRQRQATLRQLADAPRRIALASTAPLIAVPVPGSWTAQQVVLHLVAVEVEVFQRRLRDLATAVEPRWAWIEPGPAEVGPGETLAETVARFAAERAATLAWVTTLDDAGWRRFGHHATLGMLDVGGLLAVATAHDAEHLAALLAAGPSSRRPPRARPKG